ncbi:MAG: Gfo/Idh/MocA family oxidoreductase [Phycisphaeraceae bacterium]
MLSVGVYGSNGHQIHRHLRNHPQARLVAAAAIDDQVLGDAAPAQLKRYDTLAALLDDEDVQLVSLCSPRRADQAEDAIRCLQAGRHVYAEKPAALSERDLDRVLAAAANAGRQFHEMAGTTFAQPYAVMKKVVAAGAIGTVVQVLAQKSYPWRDARPQDEAIDGGLLCQAGVHAVRMVEQVGGHRAEVVAAHETTTGNPVASGGGGCRIAAAIILSLANGGIATVTANYLNPKGTGVWGYEMLRLFGTQGMVESTHGGRQTRLVVGDRDLGSLDVSEPPRDYFDFVVDSITGVAGMPISLDDELHPTRVVLRAKAACSLK